MRSKYSLNKVVCLKNKADESPSKYFLSTVLAREVAQYFKKVYSKGCSYYNGKFWKL